MTRLKSILIKMGKVIPALALMVGTASVSQACIIWFHRPVVPEKMKK